MKVCQPSSIREDGSTGSAQLAVAHLPHARTSGSHCMVFHSHKILLIRVDVSGIFTPEGFPLEALQDLFFWVQGLINAFHLNLLLLKNIKVIQTFTKIFPSLCFGPTVGEKQLDLWQTLLPAPGWCEPCTCVFLRRDYI